MVNYFLETHATDDVVAEADAEIITFIHLLNNAPVEYAKLLWAKAPPCHRVYDEYVQKR